MKIKSLLVVSIIAFFCTSVFAEDAAVTGLCKDGTPYTGKSKRGACRGHDGVKEWYADKATAPATAAPAAAAPAPAATPAPESQAKEEATGLCKDGSAYTGKSKRGACRGHGGVKEWYADKTATSPPPVAAPATAATVPVAVESTAPETQPKAGVTGICKDGTEYTGKSKRGACRGHKGVKEWFADKETPVAPAPVAEQAPAPAPAPSTAPTAPAQPAPAEVAPAASSPTPATATVATDTRPAQPAPGSGKVWINKKSKIYHCEGSKYYGKTKEGGYVTEAEAQAQGYVANRKKVCSK